jgi:hypothetical protein
VHEILVGLVKEFIHWGEILTGELEENGAQASIRSIRKFDSLKRTVQRLMLDEEAKRSAQR